MYEINYYVFILNATSRNDRIQTIIIYELILMKLLRVTYMIRASSFKLLYCLSEIIAGHLG